MGEVLFGGGLGLAVLALSLVGSVHQQETWIRMEETYLVSGASSQASKGTLDCTSGLVEVALSRGGLVLVGRHDYGFLQVWYCRNLKRYDKVCESSRGMLSVCSTKQGPVTFYISVYHHSACAIATCEPYDVNPHMVVGQPRKHWAALHTDTQRAMHNVQVASR